MHLLTTGNPKLMKGEKKGYLSFVLHLAPSNLSGYNTCPMASNGCRAACLNTAGRGGLFKAGTSTNSIQEARIRKTRMFFEDRDAFLSLLVADIRAAVRMAERKNLIPVFRLNGTSDIRWESVSVEGFPNLMGMFPVQQFYDYTKLANRRDLPANYHLTFSRSESNAEQVDIAMLNGMNIAVVFDVVPSTYLGRPVVDGDETDLRFLDARGVIVGLKAKGKGKKDTSGFVILQKAS